MVFSECLSKFSSMWNNVINAWWPLVFYPATDAPRFTKGMYAIIGVAVATLAATALVWALERRERGTGAKRRGALAHTHGNRSFHNEKDAKEGARQEEDGI